MNPAALKANLANLPRGAEIIVNTDEFTPRNLAKVGYASNPLDDGSLDSYAVHPVGLTSMTIKALESLNVPKKDAERAKNMFALGLLSWLYSRPYESTLKFLGRKFASKPDLVAANTAAFTAGWNFGETTEDFAVRYEVKPASMPPGQYRNITGNTALALGLVAASVRSKLPLVLGAYPITPASDVLHELAKHKRFGITTVQAEDEIAAVGVALGASYGGALGVTSTSGPGVALKGETISLAVALELPLVVVDIQRAGPSTGMPTKTEQADLQMALYGRHGEAPVAVIAARSPADCFHAAIDAVRIATKYRTPVILLSDGYIANGSEPWLLPEVGNLPDLQIDFATAPNSPDGTKFLPYLRDPITMARPWAVPGTPGLEHRIGGLEKADITGDISYDPANHDFMVRTRAARIEAIEVPDVEVDDPDGDARVLVLGWGSTYGPIGAACRALRQGGISIAQAHLRYLNPMPRNLGAVLRAYDKVVIPEMNLGQLASVIRSKFLVDVIGYNQVRGLPFTAAELETMLEGVVESNA
jgi:2-oxoglutarate ferredoxin oxidoreductase subunit alpha